VKCKVGYVVERDCQKWTHCLVEGGDAGIERIERSSPTMVVVMFQDVVF
jgi:hypothetical protein